ncbi:MAG: hypothetical protein Q9213_002899 [Squamulea squamosa]
MDTSSVDLSNHEASTRRNRMLPLQRPAQDVQENSDNDTTYTQEETEIENSSVKCVVCEEEGHRARDCTNVGVGRGPCSNAM